MPITLFIIYNRFAGLGPFRVPKIPQGIPIDSFDGPVVHTACWDTSIDLTNKKVAVLGSGATYVAPTRKYLL